MKNVFYLHPDGIILHSSFRQRRHSSFYILLPSPSGEGLGGEAFFLFGKLCFHRVVSRIADIFVLHISFLIYNNISRNAL